MHFYEEEGHWLYNFSAVIQLENPWKAKDCDGNWYKWFLSFNRKKNYD